MARFTYERVKGHTGKVQYRTDGASIAQVAGGIVRRGEVIAFAKPSITNALVESGNFAHVPVDTPLGVPVVEELATPVPVESADGAEPEPLQIEIEGEE